MKILKIKLTSLNETEVFGQKLGSLLMPGDILCLNGDLGAGKTTLTQSIGLGLGVEDYITSPTFTLINEYRGRMWLYHFDVYRLENVEEVYDLGFDEYFYGNGVCIIEWAEKIEKFLPRERIEINIKMEAKVEERMLYIGGYGKRYEEIMKGLKID